MQTGEEASDQGGRDPRDHTLQIPDAGLCVNQLCAATAEHPAQAAVELEKYNLPYSFGDPSSRGRVQFPLGPYHGLGSSLPSPLSDT